MGDAKEGRKMNIILVVTGGIAAYKACDIIGLLKRAEHNVRVVMTTSACEFITPLTLATLSEEPVHVDQFTTRTDVEHIALAKWADTMIVAPATYNFIGKMANGIADDLASTVFAATSTETKVYVAPAMNTNMWRNPILQKNLQGLKTAYGRRIILIDPRSARLACGDVGKGALARPGDIVQAVTKA
jgi:phosphopantothenoylcysteine decarboxylase/phosphopantothenate--cysteine ligase